MLDFANYIGPVEIMTVKLMISLDTFLEMCFGKEREKEGLPWCESWQDASFSMLAYGKNTFWAPLHHMKL